MLTCVGDFAIEAQRVLYGIFGLIGMIYLFTRLQSLQVFQQITKVDVKYHSESINLCQRWPVGDIWPRRISKKANGGRDSGLEIGKIFQHTDEAVPLLVQAKYFTA